MSKIMINISGNIHKALWAHLLPHNFSTEEAAFMFVRKENVKNSAVFSYIDWYPVPPEGFLSRSQYHFELTDATRAAIIKKAHDLDASLVELHSHEDGLPVKFSLTDFLGFDEFVPHVWWRLKAKPYMAVVISRSGLDGLVWIKSPNDPQCLNGIIVDKKALKTTGHSLKWRNDYYGKPPF